MKILGISAGSKNGNNDSMCKEALMGAKEMGAEVEFIRLLDLEIKHCTGCNACCAAQTMGRGNLCALKDDFDWLLNKMLDADGVVFSIPIFEKGVAGIFRTITDRFGPRMDRGCNKISDENAIKNNGVRVDPRIFKDKVVSYIGLGGSDWTTRFQCDAAMQAMSPAWKVIDNERFSWSTGIIMDDERVSRIHQIGQNIANAAKDIEHASYKGEKGVCPHCHSKNFYLDADSTHAVCCLCGIKGDIKIVDGKLTFDFPEEQLIHAHDDLSGKILHAKDIEKNMATVFAQKKTEEFKNRVQKYKDFITATTKEN